MIFVILYPAIKFKTSSIPTVKTRVSLSRENDFIPHPALILSPIMHPSISAKPMFDPNNNRLFATRFRTGKSMV